MMLSFFLKTFKFDNCFDADADNQEVSVVRADFVDLHALRSAIGVMVLLRL